MMKNNQPDTFIENCNYLGLKNYPLSMKTS